MEPSADYFKVEAWDVHSSRAGRPCDAGLKRSTSSMERSRTSCTFGITRLMVNGVQLTGFPSPSLTKPYFLVEKLAASTGGRCRFACPSSIRPEMLDPPGRKFRNDGRCEPAHCVADVLCVGGASAIAWLDSGDAPSFACTG